MTVVDVWKRKYAELGLSERRELRQLREENAKLKRLVADLSLDRHILQEIVRKKLYGLGTGVCWHAERKRRIRSVSAGFRAVADGASLLTVSESP